MYKRIICFLKYNREKLKIMLTGRVCILPLYHLCITHPERVKEEGVSNNPTVFGTK